MIVSWHDQYVHCVVLAGLAPSAFRFAIQPEFIKSLSKTLKFRILFGILSQPSNEYWSDCKSQSRRWKCCYNCRNNIWIISLFDYNPKTYLPPMLHKLWNETTLWCQPGQNPVGWCPVRITTRCWIADLTCLCSSWASPGHLIWF